MRSVTIGRNLENDIVYSSAEISGDHAEIFENGDSYTLVDHSKNGTFVNGKYVHHSSCTVQRGDSVVFAGVEELNWRKVSHVGDSTVSMRGNRRSPTVMVTTPERFRSAPFGVPSMVCGIVSVGSVLLSLNLWGGSIYNYLSYHNTSVFASLGLYGIISGLALGIVGLSLGANGTRRMRGREYTYRGKGMLKAGKACGIVGICLNGLQLLILIVIMTIVFLED